MDTTERFAMATAAINALQHTWFAIAPSLMHDHPVVLAICMPSDRPFEQQMNDVRINSRTSPDTSGTAITASRHTMRLDL